MIMNAPKDPVDFFRNLDLKYKKHDKRYADYYADLIELEEDELKKRINMVEVIVEEEPRFANQLLTTNCIIIPLLVGMMTLGLAEITDLSSWVIVAFLVSLYIGGVGISAIFNSGANSERNANYLLYLKIARTILAEMESEKKNDGETELYFVNAPTTDKKDKAGRLEAILETIAKILNK